MVGEATSLKEKIIEESKRIGIDKIGFTTADPFSDLEAFDLPIFDSLLEDFFSYI